MNEDFDSYSRAAPRARELAQKYSTVVSIQRSDYGWTVTLHNVTGIALPQDTIPKNDVDGRPVRTDRPHREGPSGSVAPQQKPSIAVPHKPDPSIGNVRLPKSVINTSTSRGISRSHLLAAKVFYLGRGIAEAPTRPQAEQLISQKLDDLSKRHVQTPAEAEQTLFFTLLLAEVNRGNDFGLEYRTMARDLEDIVGTRIVALYMKIVDATEKPAEVDRLTGQSIVKGGIQRHTPQLRKTGTEWHEVGLIDNALAAIGLNPSELSGEQTNFLHMTTLVTLLDAQDLVGC